MAETPASPRASFDGLNDRAQRRASRRQAMAHSVWVRLLRLVVPVLALGLVTIIFLTHNTPEPIVPLSVQDPGSIRPHDMHNELVNPTFESADTEKRPYTVTAARAVQDPDNPARIALESPVADMVLGPQEWVALRAREGAYDQTSNQLTLNGKVEIYHDDGYSLNSEDMSVDLKNQTLESKGPVIVQGPAGSIRANGLTARNTDSVIIFNGPATLLLRDIP